MEWNGMPWRRSLGVGCVFASAAGGFAFREEARQIFTGIVERVTLLHFSPLTTH